jgi:ATP-binding cassette subfamily B protein
MFKSYVCVKQHDITDCGAACLATVARTHRLRIPITAIRQFAGTDRRGTNVLGMVEAAQHLGFEAKGVKGDMEALARIPLPCIAHVVAGDLHHFVVIHKVTGKEVIVADPASGVVKYKRDDFAAIWTGVIVLLTPSATFRVGDRTVGVCRRFARLLEPHDFLLAETFLASLFLMMLGLGASIYIQLLVDRVLPEKDWTTLRWLSLGLVGVMVCRAAIGAIRGTLLAHIGQKVDVSLMLEYYRHVMRLPMQFFDTRQTGEIISRLGDAIKIREVISGATLMLLVDAATMIAAFGILCFYSLKLALLSLAILPVLGLLVLVINRPLKRAQRETMEAAEGLQSYLVESIAGSATLKALCAEDAAGFKTEKKIVGLLRSLLRAMMWGVSSAAAGELITGVGMVTVLWSAGAMVIRGEMSAGEMIAFYSILLFTLQPMLRLVTVNQQVQDAVVAADRLGEVLDLESETNGEQNKIVRADCLSGEIVFIGVSFRYGTRAPVLHDITLRIPPRSTVALVGESGSGKTTFAKMLLRYYEPIEGRIEADGYDLRDLRLDMLRSQIGYVDQDVFLFSGTIEENLRLGNPYATPEVIIGAVKAAGMEQFVSGLPNRYQTYIGERGLALSGGQRQRLAIARALVGDPRILIFDEATSNLDSQTEGAIHQLIEKLKPHKTIVIIAHRLSTVLNADQIVVMDRGRIVEQGTHQQLLLARGRYHGLWSAQFPSAGFPAPRRLEVLA